MNLSEITPAQANAIDLSFDYLSRADCAPDLVIQCLWDGSQQPARRVINLRNALHAGKRIAGYFALSAGRSGEAHFNQARAGVPDDIWNALAFVSVDVELYGVRAPEVLRAFDLAGAGKPRVLYTRRGFWDSQTYAQLDTQSWLWDARYATAGVIPKFTPYGRWVESDLIGVQINGTRDMCGTSVDDNVFDLARWDGAMPAEKAEQQLSARMQLAGAALADDMQLLVAQLRLFGVVAPNVSALKDRIGP